MDISNVIYTDTYTSNSFWQWLRLRDSVKNTDAAIEEILGMQYDMFVRIVVISANHTPFLDMPVTSHYQANQTDFIERLFNLTI